VDVTLANLCANPTAVGIQDGQGGDDFVASDLTSALATQCPAVAPTAQLVWDVDGGVIDYRTGAPIVRGGKMLVAPGGWWGSPTSVHGDRLVAFLENQGYSPVYNYSDALGDNALDLRDGGDVTGLIDAGATTPNDDYFLLETTRDPVRGTFVFVVYGFSYFGTAAADWFVQNDVLTQDGGLSNWNKSWYVYHWQGGDGGTNADGGTADGGTGSPLDTWDLLGSGP
jgi:hypothetical protein